VRISETDRLKKIKIRGKMADLGWLVGWLVLLLAGGLA